MNGKTKFVILGLLLAAILSLFLSHFWSFTLCALQSLVATGMVPFSVLSNCGVGSIYFLL